MAQANARDFAAEAAGAPVIESTVRESISILPIPKPKIGVKFASTFQDENNADEPPERMLMEAMQMRPRSNSHHTRSIKVPSRGVLKMKARFWRFLMTFGMTFHDGPRPKPPKVSFIRKISTDTIPIELFFYVPRDYEQKKKAEPDHRYPIVVNFHGGGFCLGHATDDRYWARVVLAHTSAVFVSVNYRRAPEHPFPQPVDDCVEALLYLQSHAEELHLDVSQIALSGFSAGANLVFTVPFRLTYQYERQESGEHLSLIPKRTDESHFVPAPAGDESPLEPITSGERREQEMGALTPLPDLQNPFNTNPHSPNSSTPDLHHTNTFNTTNSNFTNNPNGSRTNLLNIPGPRSALIRTITNDSFRSKRNIHANPYDSTTRLPRQNTSDYSSSPLRSRSPSPEPPPQIRIVSCVAWYPLLDWTSSRAEKKRGSRNPKKTLPAVFTDLFDFSYLPAPDAEGLHCSPYASPSLAGNHMIQDGLPQRIQMWLCEWDMLLHEGEQFRDRLQTLGKDVKSEVIPGVPHGWDKSPNPFRDQRAIDALYIRAAGYLSNVFGEAQRRATVGEGIGLGGMR